MSGFLCKLNLVIIYSSQACIIWDSIFCKISITTENLCVYFTVLNSNLAQLWKFWYYSTKLAFWTSKSKNTIAMVLSLFLNLNGHFLLYLKPTILSQEKSTMPFKRAPEWKLLCWHEYETYFHDFSCFHACATQKEYNMSMILYPEHMYVSEK